MNKQTEAELLDRISQLENQVADLTPKSQPLSPTDRKVAEFNRQKRSAEIDSMIDGLRKSSIEKPKEPPLPSIAGKSFYSIDHQTIPPYGVVTIEQLAEILETDVQSIENDAAKFGLTVDELIRQCTKLKAIVYPGEGKRYQRLTM